MPVMITHEGAGQRVGNQRRGVPGILLMCKAEVKIGQLPASRQKVAPGQIYLVAVVEWVEQDRTLGQFECAL